MRHTPVVLLRTTPADFAAPPKAVKPAADRL
jgi:hypothetical protein